MGLFGRAKEAPVTGTLTLGFEIGPSIVDGPTAVTYTLDELPGPRVWQTTVVRLLTHEEAESGMADSDSTIQELVDPMVSKALEQVCRAIPSLTIGTMAVSSQPGVSGLPGVGCIGKVSYLPSEWQKLTSEARSALRQTGRG